MALVHPEPWREIANDSAPPLGLIDAAQRDLLCALAYVHVACGQTRHALALLRLVEREAPADVGLLRVLAYAHIADGQGETALELVDRLDELDTDPAARSPLLLLRSRALHLAGNLEEARACFRRYVAARSGGFAE